MDKPVVSPVERPVIAVLGAGSWGTALAVLLARNGFPTLLWGHDAAHIDEVRATRENSVYLPGVTLPESLSICDLRVVTSTARS